MNRSVAAEKSLDFAVRIVNAYKHLVREKKEYILSKQLVRCGTSIGANVAEAQRGQTKADFYAKMSIALKEANEAQYWIELLYRTDYFDAGQYQSLNGDVQELMRILTAICVTASKK